MSDSEINPTNRESELSEWSTKALVQRKEKMEARRDRLRREKETAELHAALLKQRAVRISGGALTGVRLDMRIERLFEAIRGPERQWPFNETLQVFDGVAARILSKRVWLVLIGLFTIVPAVGSLALLAKQNSDMIEQNQVEEERDYISQRINLIAALHGTVQEMELVDGKQVLRTLPFTHRRLRAEAFGSLIALEKTRWSAEELTALPPTRFVDLRGSNLEGVSVGGRIGTSGKVAAEDDFSRMFLAETNLKGASILQSDLTGSVFRGAQAEGLTISSPSAIAADFSEINAPNSVFSADFGNFNPLDMKRAVFDRANMEGAVFDQVMFFESSFKESILIGTTYQSCTFAKCDFTEAVLGEGLDFSSTPLQKCVFRQEQLDRITIASFCYTEPGEAEDTVRVMTDIDKYNAWFAEKQSILEAKAEEELRALNEGSN